MPIKRYEVVAFWDTGTFPDKSYSHCYTAVVSHESMKVNGHEVRRLVRDYIKARGMLDGSHITLSAVRRGYVFRQGEYIDAVSGPLHNLIEEAYGTRKRLLAATTFYFFGYIKDPLGTGGRQLAPQLGKLYVVVEASTDRWPVPYAW